MKGSAEETIFEYLAKRGPQSTFRIARELGIARESVVNVLNRLSKEGRVEFRRGLAIALKKIPPELKVTKPKKIKRSKIKPRPEKLVTKRIKVKRVVRPKVKKKPSKPIVKKEIIKEVPRIIWKKVVKEVIPEEKLKELETKIEAKLGGSVGVVKEALTSKIKELADAELNIAAKLKELGKKISEFEARPAEKVEIRRVGAKKIKERKVIKKARKIRRIKKLPTKLVRGKPEVMPKELKSLLRPEKRKVKFKLKLPKFKPWPAKPKIKPKKKAKKRRKGFFAAIKTIGKIPVFSKKILKRRI